MKQVKIEYLLTRVFMNSPLPFFLSCFSIDFTGQEFVMKATRVQYCQMSVICPSNFWCVWQCDMMSDKNTCSPALKKPSNKPMENPIIFYGFHSTNWRRCAVFCRSSLWKQSGKQSSPGSEVFLSRYVDFFLTFINMMQISFGQIINQGHK